MTLNSLICKLFEQDENNDVTVEQIIKRLFYCVLIIVIVAMSIYGGYLNLSGYSEETEPYISFGMFVFNAIAQGISITSVLVIVIGILFISWIEICDLWSRIKDKSVAHCQVKKEEDESHD